MFTVEGKTNISNKPLKVTWEDGVITESPKYGLDVHTIATALREQGVEVGPVCGPYYSPLAYNIPLAVLFLLLEHVFAAGATVSGDPPWVPSVEPGAIP